MRLRVTTPPRIFVDREVTYVQAEDSSGRFGILPGHEHYLTVLVPSILIYRYSDGGGEREAYIAVRHGVLRVTGDGVEVAVRDAHASDDLAGRDIMSLVTASTERIDFVGRVYGLGRGYVVFVVSVCERLAVAINAADVGLGMAVSEEFDLVVGMAHKAGGVFGCSLGSCNGRSFLGFGWFVKEQWSTCIDYKGRRSLGFDLVVSGRSSLDVGRLRLGRGCAAQEN